MRTVVAILFVCGCVLSPGAAAQNSRPSFEGLKALQHPDAAVRYKAASLLARLGPQAKFAVAELRKALADMDPFVRVKVAEAIWKVEQPAPLVIVPTLVKALDDKRPAVRTSAVRVLAMLGPRARSAVPALVKSLKDEDVDVKLEVLIALADIGPAAREAVQSLLTLTEDKDLALFEPLLATALGSLGRVPPLAEALGHQDVRKRRVAAAALDFMGDDAKEALAALTQAVRDTEAVVRAHACSTLGKIGSESRAALPVISQACKDPAVSVRVRAALAAWQISGHDDSWTVLAAALKDENALHRQAACEAFVRMGPAAVKAVPALTLVLNDDEPRVRKVASAALGNIGMGAQAAASTLKKCFKDKDQSVRLESAYALWKVTGKSDDTVVVLKSFVGDDSNEAQFALRGRALFLAAQMGTAAKSLVPFILDIFSDEESDFRMQAAEALKKIDAGAAAKAGIR